MKSIDFKSLLIGILGTALVMVLMGQSTWSGRYDVECVYRPRDGINDYVLCREFELRNKMNTMIFSAKKFYDRDF